jgi:glucosamine-6-phosphate deaminase
MACKVIVTRDYDHMSQVAAEVVGDDIARVTKERGSYVLGLATGSSPTGLYKRLAKVFNEGKLDPSAVTSFNLDEYVGLPGENAQARALHPESYSYFMIQELFGLLRNKFRETNVPWGCLVDQAKLDAELRTHPGDWQEQGTDNGHAIVIDPEASSEYLRWLRREVLDAYEAKIACNGGIDLHVVGVGGRGHVAFHESGIPFEGNGMLLVELDENTVANAVKDGHFPSGLASPRFAISMGAELVYKARSVVLLASGPRKAPSVAASLAEDVTCAVPISYGQTMAQRGGRLTYVIDRDAATEVLARRAEIEARGFEIQDISDGHADLSLAQLAFVRDPQSGRMG